MSIIDQANTSSVFVDIERLLVVLLYEDEFSRPMVVAILTHAASAKWLPSQSGATRSRVGGLPNSVLYKDMMLRRSTAPGGQRIRLQQARLHCRSHSGLIVDLVGLGVSSRHLGDHCVCRHCGPDFVSGTFVACAAKAPSSRTRADKLVLHRPSYGGSPHVTSTA